MHNTTARLDSCSIVSDRWLSPQAVNRFANEVKRKSVSISSKESSSLKSDIGQDAQSNPDGDNDDWENDDDAAQAECIKRWRNAGPEQRKKMFALFDKSGIFIATCRHRFFLLGCDMIRSGEL